MTLDLVSLIVGGASASVAPALGEFGKKIAGRLADNFYDKLKAFRGTNAAETVERSCEMVAASGRETREIPPRTLMPILSGASLEDDAELRELWAALLANAAASDDPDHVPPYFATILAQLTPFAARVLRDMPRTGDKGAEMRAMIRGLYSMPGAVLTQIAKHWARVIDSVFPVTK